MVKICSVLALMACAAHAKPTEDALAKMLLNSGVLVNPSKMRSTHRKPIAASRQVAMKEVAAKEEESGKFDPAMLLTYVFAAAPIPIIAYLAAAESNRIFAYAFFQMCLTTPFGLFVMLPLTYNIGVQVLNRLGVIDVSTWEA
eukprot:CAMPEP_0169082936 /NCGR_PEP_ID=MMETSP1015-20121227/11809_1 /TAXON_ID=342587 /ORGANISM="Karlodinium micrum, Strain CCMP2283" /LENGTH=142 /DNA_ID=CAMNT_0009142823 /DNA_START=175 /DNA_END=603 /DNA_ORIENTATION=-